MAVTKATYTVSPTWTAVQLADIFKTAFIDAGLMTDWFDSFLSGTVENRILRVIIDGAKTYGTTYYWFMFTTGGAWLATTGTWNATTHVPTGTQYVDYMSTATNTTANHTALISLSSTISASITRYTSGVTSGCTWFLMRQGTTMTPLNLASATFNCQSFIDLNKQRFDSALTIGAVGSGARPAYLDVYQLYFTRASYLGGVMMRGSTSGNTSMTIYGYACPGNDNTGYPTFNNSATRVVPPCMLTNTHSGLGADHAPVWTSPTISPYMPALPSDFGIIAYWASSAMVQQDVMIVSAGVEEWEILAVAKVTTTTTAGKLMFCARTV